MYIISDFFFYNEGKKYTNNCFFDENRKVTKLEQYVLKDVEKR